MHHPKGLGIIIASLPPFRSNNISQKLQHCSAPEGILFPTSTFPTHEPSSTRSQPTSARERCSYPSRNQTVPHQAMVYFKDLQEYTHQSQLLLSARPATVCLPPFRHSSFLKHHIANLFPPITKDENNNPLQNLPTKQIAAAPAPENIPYHRQCSHSSLTSYAHAQNI